MECNQFKWITSVTSVSSANNNPKLQDVRDANDLKMQDVNAETDFFP